MIKVHNIYGFQTKLNFSTPESEFDKYWVSYLSSELGKIYQAIPWQELADSFKLKQNRKGPSRVFSPEGMLGLMFLKSWVNCSDRRLIEHLNGNIDFQLFCGIYLGTQRITNYKIVSDIRCQLSHKLNISQVQKVLAQHWKPYINHSNIMLSDATCYETSMRYPTDVKLLWESVDWCYGQLRIMCKTLKQRLPRNKYTHQKDQYIHYSRRRKKAHKQTKVRIRSLLYLLEKLLGQMAEIENCHQAQLKMPQKYYERIKIVEKVLKQQQQMFVTGSTTADRIVSLSKSYIRPIIRGKEVKRVEFGAKVNMIQFDGINFIEHLSFNAFHEGIRLNKSVWYARELMGKISHVSADAIYATNANRKWCRSKKIFHSFTRKGRAGKHEGHRLQMSSILNKERATRLEGSFGTEKEHYGLQKIKAGTQKTETLWIFFGVHMSNAVRIAKRLAQEKDLHKVA
jgi:hypothetical protein